MSNFSRYYLQQMGITLWQCHKPQYFPHLPSQAEKISLPTSCHIVIVCNEQLNAQRRFIKQVLKSLQLDLDQALIIEESQLQYYYQAPEWIWTIGCQQSQLAAKRQLSSPDLAQLINSAKAKKQLWQQIVSYLK